MKSIRFSALRPGMMIVEDVLGEDGLLVLKKDTYVTDFVLDLLESHNVQKVTIDDASEATEEKEDSNINLAPNGLLTENKLMQTEEFLQFKTACLKMCDTLEVSLNNIVLENNSMKHAQSLINDSLDFYREYVNATNILDMLQCMHHFIDTIYLHSLNVGMIASLLGRWLGWAEDDIELLVACGVFHDIGKIKIPDYILEKPDKLTKAEFAIMRAHTMEGYNVLKDLDIDERIKDVALRHHRKYDGSGYPNQVDIAELDRFTKVITIADVYEAMTANRSYREAFCPFKVVDMFQHDGYSVYDTEYLLTFLRHVVDSYIHSHIALSNGSMAEVIMINNHNLSRPLVFTNDGEFLDLSQRQDISILHMAE